MTVTGTAPVRPINGATVPSVQSKPVAARKTRAEREAAKVALTLAQRQARARAINRWVGIMAGAIVWGFALVISYFHIAELMIRHGQSQSAGHMYPVIIDGLMIVASVAIIAQPAARMPKVIFGFGALCTVAGNVASVVHPDVIAYLGAGVTGVSLIGSAWMLERLCLPQASKPVRKRATRARK